jgi:hypothetical protein
MRGRVIGIDREVIQVVTMKSVPEYSPNCKTNPTSPCSLRAALCLRLAMPITPTQASNCCGGRSNSQSHPRPHHSRWKPICKRNAAWSVRLENQPMHSTTRRPRSVRSGSGGGKGREKRLKSKNKGADLELERREYLRRILYPNDLRLLPLDDGKNHCCLRSNKTNRLSARRKERKQGKKARWGQEAI